MDLDGFRKPQSPWFFQQPATYIVDVRNTALVTHTPTNTLPTQDTRYPGWAARMDDGRLVTDYRSKCQLNIPTGMQYASRQFMQKNAESLITQARKRQADSVGARLAYNSSTVMPAAVNMFCDIGQCYFKEGHPKGIGLERNDTMPELFGTFSEKYPSVGTPAQPSLTQREEGGRNTRRG